MTHDPTPRPERYVVTLEAMPSDAPAIIRLRAFLKAALRSYRLKAVKIVEGQPPPDRPEG